MAAVMLIALLIQETKKYHDNLRMQMTKGTTRTMNDLTQPTSDTAKCPRWGQHNLAQYKNPSSNSMIQPSYLLDNPLISPTILQPSLIPLTPNNSPTTLPCPSPPPQTAQMPAPTTALTHYPTTNFWMSQKPLNYPPHMMITNFSPLPKLCSGTKNKKTMKRSRTHGRTSISSTHGKLMIAVMIPGTAAPQCQVAKRPAQKKNAMSQMC